MTPEKRSTRRTLFMAGPVAILFAFLVLSGCDAIKQLGEKPAAEKPAAQNASKRMSFQELFDVNGAMVTPKEIIKYGSTTMTPAVPFESQVMMIDGVPFAQYVGHDAEVRKEADLYVIVSFY